MSRLQWLARMNGVVFVMVIAVGAAAARSEGAAEVEGLGDSTKFEWIGCEAAPVDEVATALRHDILYQLAATPSAPRPAFVETLRERLVQGYWYSGFPDARVDVTVTDGAMGRVRVTVREGVRYQAGAIRIDGLTEQDAAALRTALTRKRLKHSQVHVAADGKLSMDTHTEIKANKALETNDPVWKAEAPAHFNEAQRKSQDDAIRCWFAERGNLSPGFASEILREADQAVLAVHVSAEGPKAMIGRVVMEGLEKNTEAQVRAYLKVAEGQPLDLSAIRRLHGGLRDSGRFVRYDVSAEPMADEAGKMEVRLKLRENPDVPLLGEPLSEVDHAALRFIEYMNRWEENGSDLMISLTGNENNWGTVVLSARSGFAWVYEPREGRSVSEGLLDTGICCVGTPALLVVDSPGMGLHEVFRSSGGLIRIINSVSACANEPGNDKDGLFSLSFGFSVQNGERGEPPMRTLADMMPAFGLHMVHQKASTARIAQGRLIIASEAGTLLQADAATGELIELCKLNADKKKVFVVTKKPGELDRLAAKTKGAGADTADSANAMGKWVRILGEMYAHCPMAKWEPARRRVAADAWGKLLDPSAFTAIAEMMDRLSDNQDQVFKIPSKGVRPDKAAAASSPFALLAVLMPYCDDVFERGSWPWTLAREGLLTFAGRAQFTLPEVRRMLASEQVGPIGCLAVSRYLAFNQPAISRAFARMSHGKLTDEAFLADCHMLLDTRRIHGRVLMGMLGNFQRMSDAEAEQVAASFPDVHGRWVRLLHDELKTEATSGKPLDQTMLDRIALKVWHQGLKDAVESELFWLQLEPLPAPRVLG